MKLKEYMRIWRNIDSHTHTSLDAAISKMSDIDKDKSRLTIDAGE